MKKTAIKILKVGLIAMTSILLLYILIFALSFLIYHPEEQKLSEQQKEEPVRMFQPEIQNVVNVAWKDNEVLYILTQQFNSDQNGQPSSELKLIEYNVNSREINSTKNLPSIANAILGQLNNNIVLCSWNILTRQSKENVATKIEIRSLETLNILQSLDLYRTSKIDSCEEEGIIVSEGQPMLAEFKEFYDIKTLSKIDGIKLKYEIKGNTQTQVFYQDNKLLEIDLPNKYKSIFISPDMTRYALTDTDNRILIYIKQ